MIFLMARPKSGVSMLSLQKMLKIKSYKTAWLMCHKIRKAMGPEMRLTNLRGSLRWTILILAVANRAKREEGPLIRRKS